MIFAINKLCKNLLARQNNWISNEEVITFPARWKMSGIFKSTEYNINELMRLAGWDTY